jgi:hypothetical protein
MNCFGKYLRLGFADYLLNEIVIQQTLANPVTVNPNVG